MQNLAATAGGDAKPPMPRKQIRMEEQLEQKRKSLREWRRKAELGDEHRAELEEEYKQRLAEIEEYVDACEQRIQARKTQVFKLEEQVKTLRASQNSMIFSMPKRQAMDSSAI